MCVYIYIYMCVCVCVCLITYLCISLLWLHLQSRFASCETPKSSKRTEGIPIASVSADKGGVTKGIFVTPLES